MHVESDHFPSKSSTRVTSPYFPKAPFPQYLDAPSHFAKKWAKSKDILEVFKQVRFNLSLLDAIKQIPIYAKYLKDLCTHKCKSQSHVSKKVLLIEQVGSIFRYTTPPKYKDPDASTIPYFIGDHFINRAFLDLGAFVNLLPFSVYKQLGLGELKPIEVTL